MLFRKLRKKCEELGIAFKQIKEYGTSSACSACGTKVNSTERTFRCSNCGYVQDRDVVGRIMILKKYADANHLTLRMETHPVVSTVRMEREGRRIACL